MFKYFFPVFLLLPFSCNPHEKDDFFQVKVTAETDAVHANPETDAADDPAIWIHPTDSSKSIIYGSNKTYGIDAFDLEGKRLHSYEVGRINNIDVRYGFPLNDTTQIDILAGTEREHNQILVFSIDPEDGALTEISGGIQSSQKEVYGFCLYTSPVSGNYFAFLNDKNGTIEQWELLSMNSDSIQGKMVRILSVTSQPEGMVADDKEGFLYVGEENEGIWRFSLEENLGRQVHFLEKSGKQNPAITFDIEGLAIYETPDQKLLLASSQGNNSYAAFDIRADYSFLGSFQIVAQDAVDGTEDTDGIEVCAANLGAKYPSGIFVAQDGGNLLEDGSLGAQNFKIVSWESIAPMFAE